MASISRVMEEQKRFYSTHITKSVKFRISSLKKLREVILACRGKLCDALWADLHKPQFESYSGEVGFVLQELNIQLRRVKRWAAPRRVRTPLLHFFSSSMIYPEPYGRVLIFSPWNFPFQLAFTPLIGAVAAGNCVILKPSRHTPHTSSVMEEMIERHFHPEYLAFFQGGREINQALLNEKFDYIFFTGSPAVGKKVMESASKNLTPVSLELGGKNPCIVHKDASVGLAAKRIIWGKFFNAGQSCVAPDYLLVHQDIKDELLLKMTGWIRRFYGEDPSVSKDYVHVINPANVERMKGLMERGRILAGGKGGDQGHYVAPTLIDGIRLEDPVMEKEIFGPVLPVLSISGIDEAVSIIRSRPSPLALYLFTNSRKVILDVFNRTSFGTSSVNDTVVHFINPHLPFGGVGESGIGKYHGKKSFDTFTNYRSVMKKTNLFDIPVRYPPYTNRKLRLLERFMH